MAREKKFVLFIMKMKQRLIQMQLSFLETILFLWDISWSVAILAARVFMG